MKRFLIIFGVLFFNIFSVNLFSQGSPSASMCQKFRTGTFVSKLDDGTKVEVVRNGGEQTEKFANESIKLRVKWLNDCEYHLTILSFSGNPSHEIIGQTLKVTITSVDDNSYYYSVRIGEKVIVGNNKVTKVK